jgi:hypothetical protein
VDLFLISRDMSEFLKNGYKSTLLQLVHLVHQNWYGMNFTFYFDKLIVTGE